MEAGDDEAARAVIGLVARCEEDFRAELLVLARHGVDGAPARGRPRGRRRKRGPRRGRGVRHSWRPAQNGEDSVARELLRLGPTAGAPRTGLAGSSLLRARASRGPPS